MTLSGVNTSDTSGSKEHIDVDRTSQRDADFLSQLGYKQEFKRRFSTIETFGISFALIGLVPSMASTLIYAVPNGGPVALVWGWLASCVLVTLISIALAELGSAAPTSGGLYYWTYRYSSPKWRNLLCWITGYANTMGQVSGLTGVTWGGALQVMACASIGSGLKFTPTTGQTFGVFTALLLIQCMIASFGTRVIARLQGFCIAMNMVIIVALIASVAAATPSNFRNTASFAFGDFINLTPWPNGFAFILSFLYPLWVINAFDAGVHISEEVSNARVAVPIAIIAPAVSSAIFGFAINIVLALCMGTDTASILQSPIGQPMATILFNSLGTRGTLAIFSCIAVGQFLMGIESTIALSRQTFAFSRDKALPFSRFIYRINPRTQTPVNAVWIAAFLSFLLGLLAFAGPVAIGAIFSLAVGGQYIAYSLPIAARFMFKNDFEPGPFSLGKLSLPIGVSAVICMVFIIIVFCFPAAPDPNGQTMNYMAVVLGGWLLLSLAFYYMPVVGGVHWFQGPIANVKGANQLEDPGQRNGSDEIEKWQEGGRLDEENEKPMLK